MKQHKDIQGKIAVKGGSIWYRIRKGSGTATPLLVVHGGPGVPHNYLEALGDLAEDRPVIWYDQLGCGNSDKPADVSLWTASRFAEEIPAIRKALNLNEIHLLGQSWGAFLATYYMLHLKPSGVKSLVLSAPLLSTARWIQDQRQWLALMPEDMKNAIERCEADGDYASEEYQSAMNLFYNRHVCRLNPWPEEVLQAMEGMSAGIYNYMWGPSEFTMTGTLRDADLSDRLKEINIPALITCGSYDEATPDTAAYFQSQLPGSVLHVFEGSSHMHHLESRAEYMNVLSSFLKKYE